MDKQPQSRTPLIVAAVLLLLPVLYVGSYMAMVLPRNAIIYKSVKGVQHPYIRNYRTRDEWAEWIFWPLEQIDRRLRPGAWEPQGVPVADPFGSPDVPSDFVPVPTDDPFDGQTLVPPDSLPQPQIPVP